VKRQGSRDENIQELAFSMRDMLGSLAEVKQLEKIQLLESVINAVMTRVAECAKFIIGYSQHGFWGESTNDYWFHMFTICQDELADSHYRVVRQMPFKDFK